MEGRKYSHDSVDMTGINVMLNTKDVSEYLKISPNGLEVSFRRNNIIYIKKYLYMIRFLIIFIAFVGSV